MTLRELAWSKLSKRARWVEEDRGHETPCWVWQFTVYPNGYGRIQIATKPRLAHRVCYEAVRGPIPAGLTLDHLCRVRACVNPDHLEPVTVKENLRRGVSPSALNAVKTHCKHGHEFTAANTLITPEGHRSCRTCAREKTRRWAAARSARSAA